jgi:hypothetical protein
MRLLKKTVGILFLFINWMCIQSSPKTLENNVSNENSFNEDIDSQLIKNNSRTVKLFFWYTDDAHFDSYTGYIVRIGNNEFTLSKDTLTLVLPQQNIDTIFTKLVGEKLFKVYRLLKFKNHVTYKLRVNSCSDIDYFQPQEGTRGSDFPKVSFTIKNYRKQEKIVGICGFKYDTDDDLILKNNIKTPYEILASPSAMCGTDPRRVAIEYKTGKTKVPIMEFWFQDMHGAKLDVIYDFKTKKTEVTIEE